MWYLIGAIAAVVVVRAATKQHKADEARRQAAYEKFVSKFPGWGE